jgi:Ca-activated chloride channel family protein
LFAGDQAVIVGRYSKPGDAKVVLGGAIEGKEQSFDFPAKLVESSADDTNAFIAKLWAARRVGEIIDQIDLSGKNDELMKELVDLATKHGILTQYTSFLADETSAQPTDLATNLQRGGQMAEEALAETEGRYAFSQRATKANLRNAPQADAMSLGGLSGAPAPAEMPALDQLEMKRQLAAGNTLWYNAKADCAEVATNILSCGRKTFFQQNGRWVDSSLSDADQQNATKVERFSREYFDLASQHGQHVSQYLAIDAPVVVRLDGKVYEW